MALHAVAGSALGGRVAGLVLDSPVLDWEATLRALATARRAPAALLPLAVRAAMGRSGLRGDRPLCAANPPAPGVPALIFHGPDDVLAPWGPSRELARRRPELISLHTVSDAPHAAMWNADPAGYQESLRRFLTSLL
jgi:pimeloyl-ACP methyl ester carboxylesterase